MYNQYRKYLYKILLNCGSHNIPLLQDVFDLK